MIIFYKLWLIITKIILKHSVFIDHNFLVKPLLYVRYTNLYQLPFLHKWFLVFFYEKSKFLTTYYFVERIQMINLMRLHLYTTSYNFFSKKFLEDLQKNESKKRSNSILKISTVNTSSRNTFNINNYVNIILLEKIQYSLDWRVLPVENYLARYLKSKSTYALVNPKTINGFFSFLGKDAMRVFDKRVNKKDSFYNVIVNDFDIDSYVRIRSVKLYKNIDSIPKYKKFYENLNRPKSKDNIYFGDVFLKTLLYKKFEIDAAFQAFYKILYSIKFKPTDISQYLEKSKSVTALFIRKNKIFNKGRYSRNRQLYRTGVYWCLWLNIINVFGLYYYFYRFVFNFGYFYLPMLLLILSIFGSRLIKYRYYNISYVINEIVLFIELFSKFMSEIIKNFLIKTKDLAIKLALYIYYSVIDYFKEED